MRPLTSLFKKSQFSDPVSRSTFFVGASLAALCFYGCQNLLEPSQSSSPEEQEPAYAAAVKVYVQDAQRRLLLGEFDRSSCEQNFPEQWSFSFTSPFGQHRFHADYGPVVRGQSDRITLKTSPQRFEIATGTLAPSLLAHDFCGAAKRRDEITLDMGTPVINALLEPLQKVAPECAFDLSGPGSSLQCRVVISTQNDLQQKLDQLKRTMTTRWNHQPYLLIRRLTLASELLEALQAPNNANDLQKTCRIIQYSLPQELPLSFRSKLWVEKVCRAANPDRDLAAISLDHAARELDALSKRIEDASLIGTFTLSVPRDQSPHRDYWVSLQPVDIPYVASEQPSQTTACTWHPLYGDQIEHHLIAKELGQLRPADHSFCASIPTLTQAKREADMYIRSSMASEMEFQIANGQSKKLRLPTGNYKYSVTEFTGPFAEESASAQDTAPLSVGSINWNAPRPHMIIRSW